MKKFCNEHGKMKPRDVWKWIRDIPEFAEQYKMARDFFCDLVEDEILDMADDTAQDKKEDGTFDHEHINRSRLKVDTRKWWLAKQRPKKWSDKTVSEVTGKDGAPLVNVDGEVLEKVARWLAFKTSEIETK